MAHHVIPTVLIVFAIHSVTIGQEVRLAKGSARILPVAQQTDPPIKPRSVGGPEQLAGDSIYGKERYPVREAGQFVLPELTAPTTSLEEVGSGSVPGGMEKAEPTVVRPLPEGPDREGMWRLTAYHWYAPNTFSNPRYFEDAMLERHGHERFPLLQPAVSGFRFFATVPMLPYLMTVRPPCDTEYTLGFYRPGSRAPALLQRPPYEGKAALVEAAAVLPFAF